MQVTCVFLNVVDVGLLCYRAKSSVRGECNLHVFFPNVVDVGLLCYGAGSWV